MPPDRFWPAIARTPSKTGTRPASIDSVTPLARRHLAAVPDQAEAGDVGARVHGAGRQRLQRLGRRAVQRAHRSDRLHPPAPRPRDRT